MLGIGMLPQNSNMLLSTSLPNVQDLLARRHVCQINNQPTLVAPYSYAASCASQLYVYAKSHRLQLTTLQPGMNRTACTMNVSHHIYISEALAATSDQPS